jgi:hypothetical protein
VRLVVALAVLTVAAAVFASPASATRECDGLDVCIRVPGPWVAVPAAGGSRASTVVYRLSCPRGSIAGGLDAVVADRGLDVVFLGALGSPVNPGITTRRHVVFVATSAARRLTAFRPLLGCIPTSGGGGRRTTSVRAAAPRPRVVRRVATFRVPTATRSGTVRCGRGERLLSMSYAAGFRARTEPRAAVLAGVTARLTRRGNRVVLTARRAGVVPRTMRVEVQVHAVCGTSAR